MGGEGTTNTRIPLLLVASCTVKNYITKQNRKELKTTREFLERITYLVE